MNFRKILFLVSIIVGQIFAVSAQNKLITSKAFVNALEQQTRSKSGVPGEKYWQNSSDYSIKATVDIAENILTGQEQITYYNNSPDTIETIIIRLYQDIFKKAVNRNTLFEVAPEDITDGVSISEIKENNNKINLEEVKRSGTLMYVQLQDKLLPKGQLKVDIAWSFNIPEKSLIRMGTFDSTSVFLGQWYPQIAVYDDVYGWDKHTHNGLAEFYNDVNDFDVEITVPENFLVWATGEPVNINEVLLPQCYNRYKKATTSDEIIHVISEDDIKSGNITTDMHIWKFHADNVTDFAFCISDHYLWDVTSVVVDSATKRRTVVAAAYKKDAAYFDRVADIAKTTIKYLSEEMPGIPFPFPYMTVFNGDFGMEYPMITNVGADNDYGMTVYGNSHEITHSYFPFYVCTNETKSGWMDEGFTVFLPEKIQTRMVPELNEGIRNAAVFAKYSGLEDEPAVITSTHYLDSRIYFYLNYAKSDLILHMLELELGEKTFKKCLLTFMDNWKYKHPTPYDFFNSFNTISEQNLNWFWNAWYYQQGGIPDLAIKDIITNDNRYTVTITNNGDLPLPIFINCYNNDELVQTISKSAKMWIENTGGITINFESTDKITKIILGNEHIPDANQTDNFFMMEK